MALHTIAHRSLGSRFKLPLRSVAHGPQTVLATLPPFTPLGIVASQSLRVHLASGDCGVSRFLFVFRKKLFLSVIEMGIKKRIPALQKLKALSQSYLPLFLPGC